MHDLPFACPALIRVCAGSVNLNRAYLLSHVVVLKQSAALPQVLQLHRAKPAMMHPVILSCSCR